MGGYAAGTLISQAHDVVHFDAAGMGLDFTAAKARIAALLPALLAVNAVYFWEHSARLLDFINDIKKTLASTHITLFGFFPSLAPEQILKRCTAYVSAFR
jgi:anaerobic magnesium-protoporphyrin IX monomethyl ester cyclase